MTRTLLRLRGMVALGMVAFVLFMLVTGVVLWIANQGGIVPQGLWNFASTAHPVGGVSFFVLGVVHIALNRKLFLSDLATLFKKDKG